MTTNTLFKDIVGQTEAKKQLSFYLKAYETSHSVPHLMFNGPIGQGKTEIARTFARGLHEYDEDGKLITTTKGKPKIKKFIEANCAQYKNLGSFVNNLILPEVQDKHVTLFFDEAGDLANDIEKALLTILNPGYIKTQYKHGDYLIDFDFTKQTFIFATSEPQQVFHALLNRMERVDLEDYSPSDMMKIVQIKSPEINFKEDVLEEIGTVLRGNARAAAKMAEKIQIYLGKNKNFGRKDWETLKEIFSIHPLGLNPTEVMILKHLSQATDGVSLTNLHSKTLISREALQRLYETYLLRHSLISIETTGRIITAKGLQILREIVNKGKEEFKPTTVNILKEAL